MNKYPTCAVNPNKGAKRSKGFVEYIVQLVEAEKDEPSDECSDDEQIKNNAKFKKHKITKTVE